MKSLFLFLLFVAYSQSILACDCIITSVKEHIKSTSYLLTGKVIEILDGNTKEGRDYRDLQRSFHNNIDTISHGYAIRFLIQEDFKGLFKAGDIIEIGSAYTTCDMQFDVGKDYVLFLHKEQDILFPTYCSYSGALDESIYSNKVIKMIRKRFKKRLPR
jgi:hypothetical protein